MLAGRMLPLHTPRLVLRRLHDGDVGPFLAYRNDPEVARFQGWEGCSPAAAVAFIARQKAQPPLVPGEWLQIGLALRDTDELVGDCGLCLRPEDARQATIGFTLARPFQGRGFATEALGAMLDYLFGAAALHRVVADTGALNAPACALLERLGFRREAHLRQSLWFKGRWTDEYLYAILREEWLARRA